MSDYYWPDPDKPDGKPYVMRDGQSNPGNFNEHRKALMAMRDATAALASAYGIAVTTTMVITALLAHVVARRRWGWSPWSALGVPAAAPGA